MSLEAKLIADDDFKSENKLRHQFAFPQPVVSCSQRSGLLPFAVLAQSDMLIPSG